MQLPTFLTTDFLAETEAERSVRRRQASWTIFIMVGGVDEQVSARRCNGCQVRNCERSGARKKLSWLMVNRPFLDLETILSHRPFDWNVSLINRTKPESIRFSGRFRRVPNGF